jgi:hypothetical protein
VSFIVSVKVFIVSLALRFLLRRTSLKYIKTLSHCSSCLFSSSFRTMSIFTRPDSPPPRQPSPEFIPAPLPSPHLQARLRKSSSKISLSPSVPPGLHSFPTPHNSVHSTRSYEHLGERSGRRRISSTPVLSPLTRPHSTPLNNSPAPSHSLDHSRPYRRYPSHGPTISSPPPPVPPIPAMGTALREVKSIHSSQSISVAPICLPEFDSVSPVSESTCLPRQHPTAPSPQKQRLTGVGMTCLKFFSLRNTKQRPRSK